MTTIEETVERCIADFERGRANAVRYFWSETYDRALTETDRSRPAKSIALAKAVLFGRRQQLEQFPNDPDAKEELKALRVAINHLPRG
jgi:hypothetical protein